MTRHLYFLIFIEKDLLTLLLANAPLLPKRMIAQMTELSRTMESSFPRA